MAYQLLTGEMPFSDLDPDHKDRGRTMANLIRSILNDDISAKREILEKRGISELPIDFVMMCLTRDVKARPDAEVALKHPFLLAVDDETIHGAKALKRALGSDVIKRLQWFAQAEPIRKSLMVRIAQELISGLGLDIPEMNIGGDTEVATTAAGAPVGALGSPTSPTFPTSPARHDHPSSGKQIVATLVKRCQNLFHELDVDHDGCVGFRDLRRALKRQRFYLTEMETTHLLRSLSTDHDDLDRIGFAEFLAAVIDWEAIEGTAEWMVAARRVFSSLKESEKPLAGDGDGEGGGGPTTTTTSVPIPVTGGASATTTTKTHDPNHHGGSYNPPSIMSTPPFHSPATSPPTSPPPPSQPMSPGDYHENHEGTSHSGVGVASLLSSLTLHLPPDEMRSAVAEAFMRAGVIADEDHYRHGPVDATIHRRRRSSDLDGVSQHRGMTAGALLGVAGAGGGSPPPGVGPSVPPYPRSLVPGTSTSTSTSTPFPTHPPSSSPPPLGLSAMSPPGVLGLGDLRGKRMLFTDFMRMLHFGNSDEAVLDSVPERYGLRGGLQGNQCSLLSSDGLSTSNGAESSEDGTNHGRNAAHAKIRKATFGRSPSRQSLERSPMLRRKSMDDMGVGVRNALKQAGVMDESKTILAPANSLLRPVRVAHTRPVVGANGSGNVPTPNPTHNGGEKEAGTGGAGIGGEGRQVTPPPSATKTSGTAKQSSTLRPIRVASAAAKGAEKDMEMKSMTIPEGAVARGAAGEDVEMKAP